MVKEKHLRKTLKRQKWGFDAMNRLMMLIQLAPAQANDPIASAAILRQEEVDEFAFQTWDDDDDGSWCQDQLKRVAQAEEERWGLLAS